MNNRQLRLLAMWLHMQLEKYLGQSRSQAGLDEINPGYGNLASRAPETQLRVTQGLLHCNNLVGASGAVCVIDTLKDDGGLRSEVCVLQSIARTAITAIRLGNAQALAVQRVFHAGQLTDLLTKHGLDGAAGGHGKQ
jgi:hypothetical protein